MQSPHYDYFIIGQGLAGSILAYQLIQRGMQVLLIDNEHRHSSSIVAAGIINPITGHRINITDGFAEFSQIATQLYRQLAQDLGQVFYYPIQQYRLIKTPGQFDYLKKRQSESAYNDYLGEHLASLMHFKQSDYGVSQIQQTAFVDVKCLLVKLKYWLIAQQSYRPQQLDYKNIKVSEMIKIDQHTAKHIIFCEGHQAIHNPWLKHLPFKLAKGEILTLEASDKILNAMLNWQHWLVPTAQNTMRLGSNFEWNNTSLSTSTEVKQSLLDSLHQYTNIKADVIDHQTGIRPSTRYRQPFIGNLAKHSNVICFNGFGSKGCLMIPYYAQLLSDHLINNKPLPKELTQWL